MTDNVKGFVYLAVDAVLHDSGLVQYLDLFPG
jgi:hypothetical protein